MRMVTAGVEGWWWLGWRQLVWEGGGDSCEGGDSWCGGVVVVGGVA